MENGIFVCLTNSSCCVPLGEFILEVLIGLQIQSFEAKAATLLLVKGLHYPSILQPILIKSDYLQRLRLLVSCTVHNTDGFFSTTTTSFSKSVYY